MDERLRILARRLMSVRKEIVKENAFFGRLLLHLPLAFADCETACTDGVKLIFDPKFAKRLSDRELKFVMLHEVYHCVLEHCARKEGYIPVIYNIACDIVVNSFIMDMWRVKEMRLDNSKVIHLAPDGREGREYTAEEVYNMLMNSDPRDIADQRFFQLDRHDMWGESNSQSLSDMWRARIREAAKVCGSVGVPLELKRYVDNIKHFSKCNWKQLLHDFIQRDRADYSFTAPDRRYSGDIIMPSFLECEDGNKIEKLWCLVDTSGSVSDDAVASALSEIVGAVNQIGNMSGWISFFDMDVSEPVEFESAEDVLLSEPIGYGGTSFKAIFDSLDEYFEAEKPSVMVILTDGFAPFPDADTARGIPVIWVMIDTEVDAPWGECVHVSM